MVGVLMPIIRNLLSRISFRGTALTIAILLIIVSSIMTLPLLFFDIACGNIMKPEKKVLPTCSKINQNHDLTPFILEKKEQAKNDSTEKMYMGMILYAGFFALILICFMSLSLLKKGPSIFLCPWVVYCTAAMVILSLIFGFQLVSSIYIIISDYNWTNIHDVTFSFRTFGIVASSCYSFGIACYNLIFVLSCYKNMKGGTNEVEKEDVTTN